MARRLTDEDRRLRAITETELQSTVENIAKLNHWHWYHAPDNRPVISRNGTRYVQNIRAGFPDLVLVRATDSRLIFAELKKETGTLSAEQALWLDLLRLCGAEVYVWRPSDLPAVQEVLAA